MNISVCLHDWFYWADHLCLHQYCSWVGEGMCRDLCSVLPCVFRMGMLLGGQRGRRRRTFGVINQRICWFSDGGFGEWIIVLSICCTECPAITPFFSFLWLWVLLIHLKKKVQQQIRKHSENALGVLALRFTLDDESSMWSCWQLAEEWKHPLWPVILLLLFHSLWHAYYLCVYSPSVFLRFLN